MKGATSRTPGRLNGSGTADGPGRCRGDQAEVKHNFLVGGRAGSLRRMRAGDAGAPIKSGKADMSPEQVKLVQVSFAEVLPIADQAANLFYDRLFVIAPELRTLFPEDLSGQKKKLMQMLATAVNNLHQVEKIHRTPIVRRREISPGRRRSCSSKTKKRCAALPRALSGCAAIMSSRPRVARRRSISCAATRATSTF